MWDLIVLISDHCLSVYFTLFPALSVGPMVGISRSASEISR